MDVKHIQYIPMLMVGFAEIVVMVVAIKFYQKTE
jgi:hypothetical protein